VRSSWRARLALHSYAWFHFETFLRVRLPQYGLDLPFAAAAAALAQTQRDLPPLELRFAGIFMDAREPTPALRIVLQRTLDDLVAAAAACAPARVLVVILPTAWHQPGLYAEQLAKYGWQATHARGLVQQRLHAALVARELTVIDLTATRCDGPDADANFLPTDRHLSVVGNERVAAVLCEVLAKG
jgi:hypothetical protein